MDSFVCTENKLKINNVAPFAGSHHNFYVEVNFDVWRANMAEPSRTSWAILYGNAVSSFSIKWSKVEFYFFHLHQN